MIQRHEPQAGLAGGSRDQSVVDGATDQRIIGALL
jgi:hypothetical protein